MPEFNRQESQALGLWVLGQKDCGHMTQMLSWCEADLLMQILSGSADRLTSPGRLNVHSVLFVCDSDFIP